MAKDITVLDRRDGFPEPWKPSAGDKLVGQIIGIDVRETEYGEYPILTVLTDTSAGLSFRAYHTVATNEIAKLDPDVGEKIGIAYHRKAADGRHERYRILMLDRGPRSLSRRRIGRECATSAPTSRWTRSQSCRSSRRLRSCRFSATTTSRSRRCTTTTGSSATPTGPRSSATTRQHGSVFSRSRP